MKPYRLPAHTRTKRFVSPVRDFVIRTKFGRLLFVLILLATANMGLYVRYSNQTYPRTTLVGHQLGSTACDQTAQQAAGLPLLPTGIELTHKKQKSIIDPRNLGISPNLLAITANCTQGHTWVPLVSIFMEHPLPATMQINDNTFARGLNIVKQEFEKPVAVAKLEIEKGLFAIKPSVEGVELDESEFKRVLLEMLESGQRTLELPVKITAPERTQLDQEYLWEQLVAQQYTAITFNYANTTKQLTAEEVVQWYIPEKQSYSPSAEKIRATITQLGKAAKLDLTNIDQGVAAVQAALQTQKPLAFTLLGPPAPPTKQ